MSWSDEYYSVGKVFSLTVTNHIINTITWKMFALLFYYTVRYFLSLNMGICCICSVLRQTWNPLFRKMSCLSLVLDFFLNSSHLLLKKPPNDVLYNFLKSREHIFQILPISIWKLFAFFKSYTFFFQIQIIFYIIFNRIFKKISYFEKRSIFLIISFCWYLPKFVFQKFCILIGY